MKLPFVGRRRAANLLGGRSAALRDVNVNNRASQVVQVFNVGTLASHVNNLTDMAVLIMGASSTIGP